jgi:hypothetical protein
MQYWMIVFLCNYAAHFKICIAFAVLGSGDFHWSLLFIIIIIKLKTMIGKFLFWNTVAQYAISLWPCRCDFDCFIMIASFDT